MSEQDTMIIQPKKAGGISLVLALRAIRQCQEDLGAAANVLKKDDLDTTALADAVMTIDRSSQSLHQLAEDIRATTRQAIRTAFGDIPEGDEEK